MKTLLTILAFLICHTFYAQKINTINKLSKDYQNCLDIGQGMGSCTRYFLFQMDSMLNLHFKNLYIRCNRIQKINFKKEQIK